MDDEAHGAQPDPANRPEDEADSYTRRQAALRALAQSQGQQQPAERDAAPTASAQASAAGLPAAPSSATGRSTAPRGPRRGAIFGAAAVAIIAIVALIVILVANLAGARRPTTPTNQHAAPPASKPVVRINPLGDGLICVERLAWSPDSTQVAVLGNTQTCGASSEGEQSTGISIYDARTGSLVQRLQPDTSLAGSSAVQDAIAKSVSNAYNTPELSYTDVVWTPDGKALLLPYRILTSAPNATTPTYVAGLMRLGIHSSTLTNVWLDPPQTSPAVVSERWDLTTGAPAPLAAPGAASAYSWASDGALATATAPAGGAIGNSAGGQSFSVWQPGYLLYQDSQANLATLGPATATPIKGDVGWSPMIMALSPDGHYFYAYVSYALDTFDSLTPPSTQHASPSEPSLAPRDKALLALAQQMTQATGDITQQPGYAVAWRPDGKLMATASININVAQPSTAPSALTVSMYDTTSGQMVKQFTPDWSGLTVGNSSREMVVWSPDGKRLLLQDNVYGAITIWGPGALPA
jgi:WD40 repeat protein